MLIMIMSNEGKDDKEDKKMGYDDDKDKNKDVANNDNNGKDCMNNGLQLQL